MFMVQDVSPQLHAPASIPSLHHCELLPSGTLSPNKLFLLEAALLMVFCRGNRKETDTQGDRDLKVMRRENFGGREPESACYIGQD